MTTSVSYNILNLPSEVKFDDGHIVRYTYDAAGTKLKVEYLLGYIRVMDDWNTDRQPGKDVGGIKGINGISAKGFGGIGDLVSPPGSGMKEPITQMTLQYSAGHMYRNGKLERVDNPYGYWADGSFHYHITDYQGNIRAVIDEDGTLEEVNNYYPYGGLMGAGAMGVQPYKYGAKELDRENGLDLYDSHARFYDSMIGRTTSQDPLAERYYEMSPYLWCAANPIKFIDKNGKQPVKYIDENGIKRIDWSIVVMVKALDSNANEKAIAKHEKYKKAICEGLENEFNLYLNGGGKGVKNSEGDIVLSSFNIHIVDVDNTSNTKKADELSTQYKQEIKDNQPGKNGKAAVFMNGSTNGAFGLTRKAIYITISSGAPNGTKSHELYHTTGVPDNGYDKGGILNSPPQIITPEEVDMMWNLIPEKK